MSRKRRYKTLTYAQRSHVKTTVAKLVPPSPSLSKRTENLISDTYNAINEIAIVGETMSRGLVHQHKLLKRASSRLRGRDSAVLQEALEEVQEACEAIDDALTHFNKRASEIVGNQQDVVLRVRIKGGWARSSESERYIKAASALKAKRWAQKYYGTRSSRAMAKFLGLGNLFRRDGNNQYENALEKVITRHDQMISDVLKLQSGISSQFTGLTTILNKIDKTRHPIANELIRENLVLSNDINKQFVTMLARLKEVKDLYHNVRTQALADEGQRQETLDQYRANMEKLTAELFNADDEIKQIQDEAEAAVLELDQIKRMINQEIESANIPQLVQQIADQLEGIQNMQKSFEELKKEQQRTLTSLTAKVDTLREFNKEQLPNDFVNGLQELVKETVATMNNAEAAVAEAAATVEEAETAVNEAGDANKAWKYFFR